MIINWDTPIEDLILNCNRAMEIAYKYNITFISCGEPIWQTLGEAIEEQNIKNKDSLLEELIRVCSD